MCKFGKGRILAVASAAVALTVGAAFAQSADTAYVPVKINADAFVSIQPPSGSTGMAGAGRILAPNTTDTLVLILSGATSVLHSTQRLSNAPAAFSYSRGNASLNLAPESFRDARVSLFSVNGKRVLRGKASASKTGGSEISRANIAEGVYLLSVKGVNNNSFAAKLVHNGGKLNIKVAFGGDLSSKSLNKSAKAAEDYGYWTISATPTAGGYKDTSYTLAPVKGINPPQDITLHISQMSGKSALQYFTDEGIKMGWNLGNTLDAYNKTKKIAEEGAFGTPAVTQAVISGVKTQGFDLVRIGCTWIGHIGPAPEYTIAEARLQRVAEVVGWVHGAGMKAIINIHHDGNYTEPPNTWGFLKFAEVGSGGADNEQVKDQLGKMWTQIANYFKDYGDDLIFETMNEVHSGNWGCSSGAACNTEQDRLFDWNQTALNAIRATGGNNAKRFVAVPGLGSTEPGTVIAAHARGKLLPDDPGNGTDKLIVSVHFYAPWQYTVADITGQGGGEGRHTISTAELNNIATEAGRIKTTFIDNGIAVYYGEWGAQTNTRSTMDQTIKDTHIDYIRRVATAANTNGILPIIWDDGGNFKIIERTGNQAGSAKDGFWADVLWAYKNAVGKAPVPLGNSAP